MSPTLSYFNSHRSGFLCLCFSKSSKNLLPNSAQSCESLVDLTCSPTQFVPLSPDTITLLQGGGFSKDDMIRLY